MKRGVFISRGKGREEGLPEGACVWQGVITDHMYWRTVPVTA